MNQLVYHQESHDKVEAHLSMKISIRFYLSLIFLALLAYCGCGPNLESEKRAAQNAMETAQNCNAEELAPSEWEEAMLTWQKAQTAMEVGRSAKGYLQKAKSQFKKAAEVAEANGKAMEKEVLDMQTNINGRYMKIKAALGKEKPNSKVLKEIDPLLLEVQVNSSSIEELNTHWGYVKSKALAQDTLKKIEMAEQLLAGKSR
jgi:hypothetical protein